METKELVCKICKKLQVAYFAGKFPDNVNKKWTNESGSLWNGKVCPECHRDKAKMNMRQKRGCL